MIDYLLHYYGRMLDVLGQHVVLLLGALGLGLGLSFPLSFLIYRFKSWRGVVLVFLQILYTIPSLAFFAILIPLMGLGIRTAIIVLAAYSLFFLVRSFLEGIEDINPLIVEAGEAVGYSPWQLFVKVQLPLCMPAIISGIRLAAISTVGIACIAYAVAAGGIGSLLFEGMRQLSYVKILWGALLAIILSTAINLTLQRLERHFQGKMHLSN